MGLKEWRETNRAVNWARREGWKLDFPVFVAEFERQYPKLAPEVSEKTRHDMWERARGWARKREEQRERLARREEAVLGSSTRPAHMRQPIPERVRHEVWRRDAGACVECGARERLEFDHIIPVSKGGSNTARNLELRCEMCNRRKAARV